MAQRLLLLMAAALSAAPPLPAPLCVVSDPAEIRCFSPRRHGGGTFELFGTGSPELIGRVVAEPGQNQVRFLLDRTAAALRCYRGRYRILDGDTWRESELSATVSISASDASSCDPPPSPPSPTSWRLSGAAVGHSATPNPSPTTQHAPQWRLPVGLSIGVLMGTAAAVVAWKGSRRCRRTTRGASMQGVEMGTANTEPAM